MRSSLTAFLSLAVLISCSKKESASLKSDEQKKPKLVLGMNDISIMMPIKDLPELAKVLPRLTDKPDPEQFAPGLPAAAQDSQAFVPSWVQNQRNKQLSQNTLVNDNLKDFVMTSMRLDPCTNHLQVESETACVPELRLVWQRLESESPLIFADGNVHTLYTLSNAEFREILTTMSGLHANASIDTLKMPLLPQPVIAKEGLSSPYLKGVIAVVHRYARASKLNEVANMIGHTAVSWSMGHVFIKNGEAQGTKIPNLSSNIELDEVSLSSNLFDITDDDGSSLTFAKHIASNNFLGSLQSNHLLAGKELSGTLKEQISASPSLVPTIEAFAVENPQLFNPKNTNCSTCHLSHDEKVNFKKLAQDDRAVSALWDITKFAGIFGYKSSRWDLSSPFAGENHTNLQFFSIVNGGTLEPRIAVRVVNDTAESLDLMESRGFLDPNLPLPADSGSDDKDAILAPKAELPVERDNSILESKFSGRNSTDTADVNYGDSADVSLGNNWVKGEALLYFDLSKAGSGLVKKAELVLPSVSLYPGSAEIVSVELFVTDPNWSESTVTWKTRPLHQKSIGKYNVTEGSNALDISKIVNEMHDAGKGLSISIQSLSRDIFFESKEGEEAKPAYISINNL